MLARLPLMNSTFKSSKLTHHAFASTAKHGTCGSDADTLQAGFCIDLHAQMHAGARHAEPCMCDASYGYTYAVRDRLIRNPIMQQTMIDVRTCDAMHIVRRVPFYA